MLTPGQCNPKGTEMDPQNRDVLRTQAAIAQIGQNARVSERNRIVSLVKTYCNVNADLCTDIERNARQRLEVDRAEHYRGQAIAFREVAAQIDDFISEDTDRSATQEMLSQADFDLTPDAFVFYARPELRQRRGITQSVAHEIAGKANLMGHQAAPTEIINQTTQTEPPGGAQPLCGEEAGEL
jgi:hypothetical protein